MPPATIQLTGPIHVAPTADQLYDDLASALMAAALSAVADRGVFHLALSGGSSPEPFYVRLVVDPRYRAIPWPQTHLWVVDERRVPESDPRNNWRMIRSALADHIPTPPSHLHPMPVLLDDPASAYEAQLADAFNLQPPATNNPTTQQPIPRLDFILLGIGDDAHTASLFPNSPALAESRRWIITNDGPNVTPPPRLTMTYPLLNAARHLAVLCTGTKKSATLRRISDHLQSQPPNPQVLPITAVQPSDGQIAWYLDAPAATARPAN